MFRILRQGAPQKACGDGRQGRHDLLVGKGGNAHDIRGAGSGEKRPDFVVPPHRQVDDSPIAIDRFTKGIVRNDQLRCFGATILRVRVLEGSGQENFAGMRFKGIGKRLIAFLRCGEKDIEDHQPCASSH